MQASLAVAASPTMMRSAVAVRIRKPAPDWLVIVKDEDSDGFVDGYRCSGIDHSASNPLPVS
jgi:hypothetical protein